MVRVAKDVFDTHMKKGPNQIDTNPGTVQGSTIGEEDLLRLPEIAAGEAITSAGLDKGISIVLAYTEAWLRGVGCIPLYNSMEDAATAEISRAQIWQWRVHGVLTQDDGQVITGSRISSLIGEHVSRNNQNSKQGGDGKWILAGKLVNDMLNAPVMDDFLTSVCYPYIVQTCDDD